VASSSSSPSSLRATVASTEEVIGMGAFSMPTSVFLIDEDSLASVGSAAHFDRFSRATAFCVAPAAPSVGAACAVVDSPWPWAIAASSFPGEVEVAVADPTPTSSSAGAACSFASSASAPFAATAPRVAAFFFSLVGLDLCRVRFGDDT
jgi:hypothetical protein